MDKYIIYAKSDCPFCVKASDLLQSSDKDFSVLNLKTRPKVLKELKEIYNWSTVPMVFHRCGDNIEFIGGFTDLAKRLQDGG